MSASLRAAVPSDAGLVYALIGELAVYEELTHEVEASEADIAAALFAPQPRAFCEIVEWDGAPAGFAVWFYTFSTFRGRHGIYLEDLFVRPEFRGRGLGKALVARLAERCRDGGLGRLEWSVLDWNAPSIAFYQGLGARPVEGWTGYRLDGEALAALGRARRG
ncbi:GNAT family N-acetyltransferase [Methylopila turkensis]|uniref:N-acetyltransferase n=1 Tax=Methylopila turkensis TaxID=1437816 RepID=A0A9W6JMK0_9HYPH|nr:GNAT family N-acetyltransferase [Methylopila turkensis]GLK79937.1 N-acetyltransferase [Methylopila turkensis]